MCKDHKPRCSSRNKVLKKASVPNTVIKVLFSKQYIHIDEILSPLTNLMIIIVFHSDGNQGAMNLPFPSYRPSLQTTGV